MNEEMGGTIGFVGLGMMGVPMIRRLAGAGHEVRLFHRDGEKAASLASEVGGQASRTLAELGAACDVVITMLPNSAVVRSVAFDGEDSLVKGMGSGGLVIDMSSSDPVETRRLGLDLSQRGIALLDAPVSGGVGRARLGTLAIMLGGEDEAYLARAEALLEPLGTVLRVGPLGCGHAAKALNNYVSAAGLAAACEALIVGEAFGLDPERLVDVLNASSGRNNSTENKLKPFILSGDYAKAGFSMELMAKDVAIAAGLAEGVGQDMPGIAAAARLWRSGHEALGKGADHTAIHEVLKRRTPTG